MEQFDLTVFKLGLEKGVFDHMQVMDLIYGLPKPESEQKKHLLLVWNVPLFNKFPVSLREQIIKLLVEHTHANVSYFSRPVNDIANDLAMCALRATVDPTGRRWEDDSIGYTAHFDSNVTPAIGVHEILYWAEWGIVFEDVVYRTAKCVLDEFLKDAPEKATVHERVIAKKADLLAHLKELNKSITSLMSESNSLDALLQRFQDEPCSHFAKETDAQVKLEDLTKEIFDLTAQLADTYHQLGQAETYELVKMRYEV